MKQIIIIHSSLGLSGEIISVLQHLENLLIVLLQHHPSHLLVASSALIPSNLSTDFLDLGKDIVDLD